jgi:hypothetical protein
MSGPQGRSEKPPWESPKVSDLQPIERAFMDEIGVYHIKGKGVFVLDCMDLPYLGS